MGGQQQQQPQQIAEAPQQDPETDALLDAALGGQQAQPQQDFSLPPPRAAINSAKKATPQPKPAAKKQQTKLTAPPPPMALTNPGQQPAPWAQAANAFAGNAINAVRGIPLVGHVVDPMIAQATQANREIVGPQAATGVASALVGAPRGALQIVDAAGNVALRQLAQMGPTAHQANPPMMMNLTGAYDQVLGGAKQILQQAAPGQFATGESAGMSAAPLHVPVPIANPVVRGAVQGAVGGQALGTLTAAGEQARKGPVNYGEAFKEGIPVGAMGGALGLGIGAAAKGISKLRKAPTAPKQQAAQPAKQQVKENAPQQKAEVTLEDGSQFSAVEATQRLRDPSTPPEVKQALSDALSSRDSDVAGEGLKPKNGARETPFTKLGKTPTFQDTEASIREAFDKSEDPQAIKQTQADALQFISGKFKGPILKELQTKINNIAENRTEATRPKYIKIEGEGIGDVGDLSAQAAKGADDIKGKRQEIAPTPEEIQTQQVETDERRMFPLTDQTYGTQASGLWKPRDLTDQQLSDSLEFMGSRELNKNEQKELDAINQEKQRREWQSRQQPEAPKTRTAEEFAAMGQDALDNLQDVRPEEAEALGEAYGILAEKQAKPGASAVDRFIVQKNTQKKGGYVDLIDSSTGEVISSSKRTEAQAAALAAQYNDLATNNPQGLEAKLRQGSKNFLDFRKVPDEQRQQIVDNGRDMPEEHALAEPMQRVAEDKHAYDEARARFEAGVDAYHKLVGAAQGTITKRARVYSKQVEELVAKALANKSDQLTVEVNSQRKLEPVEFPKFQRGMSPEEAYHVVENLYSDMKAAEAGLSGSRAKIESQFLNSDLGPSVNVPHEKGVVNVRAVPRRGTDLNARAEELREVVPDKEYLDRTITTVRKIRGGGKRNPRAAGRRNQRGSITIKGGRNEPPATPVEESLAEGAEKSKDIADWVNSADKVRGILTLRNTFDIAREVSTDLHNELIVGIGKEAMYGHDIKFEPDQAALVEATLKLEPWQIRQGEKVEVPNDQGGNSEIDLTNLTDEQLNYLATRKAVRNRMGESVQEALTGMLDEFGGVDNMPARQKQRYETLQQLEEALTGTTRSAETSEAAAVGIMRNALYDYIFKWNTAYHLLNLTDPFIAGSLRTGLGRVMKAKAMLASNKAVRDYIKGIPSRAPIDELKRNTNVQANKPLPKGVKPTMFTKGVRAVAKLQSKLPDLPSERWNFEDSFAAGAILRGDEINYPGGGTKFLEDLAHGNLTPDQKIDLYANALNTAHEITGAGSFGLNKDLVQRTKAQMLSLFTSQPIRVARLQRQAVLETKTNPWGAASRILGYTAASVFFGGRAILPKESDLVEMLPAVRPLFRGLQDLLDKGKLFKEVPIIGRDLTDKMRTSLTPFLGGIQTNLILGEVQKFANALTGRKWDDLSKAGLIWTISMVAGGGGLEATKTGKALDALRKGDKQIGVYPDNPISASAHPIKKKKFSSITGKKYGPGEALQDVALPGVNPKIGEFIKSSRRAKIDKLYKK